MEITEKLLDVLNNIEVDEYTPFEYRVQNDGYNGYGIVSEFTRYELLKIIESNIKDLGWEVVEVDWDDNEYDGNDYKISLVNTSKPISGSEKAKDLLEVYNTIYRARGDHMGLNYIVY